MKILICHNYYRYRGGEDEVVDFEKNLLNKNGYEVMEYYKYSSNIDNWFKNFKLFFSVFFSLKTVFELNRIIKTIRPDVAHIHNIFPIISPSIYYILKKNHIPIVQTIHNYRFYCSNGLGIKNGRLCDKCLKLSFKNLFQVCSEQRIYDFALKVIMFFMGRFNTLYTVNYFIAPSEFMKKKLAMFNINEERIAIKRNSLNVIENSDESKEKKENYFTFIGRLSEEKGIMDLIYAFKGLKHLNLKILGDGPLKESIYNLIRQDNLKNIELMGFVSGSLKYDYIRGSLANIIPSIWNEVSPVVLAECLKFGTPIIGSNLESIPEFIKDGYNGYLYNCRDIEMLKEKITKVYDMNKNEKEIMQENCRSSFSLLFDLNTNFSILLDIYKKLL